MACLSILDKNPGEMIASRLAGLNLRYWRRSWRGSIDELQQSGEIASIDAP